MEVAEITFPIRKSSLEIFKNACSTKEELNELTNKLVGAVSDVVEAVATKSEIPQYEISYQDNVEAPESGTTAFRLRQTAQQMLNSYACLLGTSAEEVAFQISEVLSEELEKVLKDKIAEKLGLSTAIPRQAVVSTAKSVKRRPPPPTFQDTTGVSDGLGDLDPEEIPAETDPSTFIPKTGGLTDEMIEQDMHVEDPEHEAAADGEDIDDAQAEFTFANVIMGEEEVDHRIKKRKKGPSKSKGKAVALTEEPRD
jgi:hypothetical protein